MDIELEILSTACSNMIGPKASLVRRNGELIIDGSIIAPNPCYGLEQSNEVKGNTLLINLRLIRRSNFCIQCIAKISFRISVKNLSEKVKNVIILYQNKEILRYSL